MKKFLALLIISTMILIGCGGGTKDTAPASEKKTQSAKEVKKELIVTMKIGEEEVKFKKSSIINGAMNPGQKSDRYEISCTPLDGENIKLGLDFTTTGVGEATRPYVSSIKGYVIKKGSISVQIEKFETKKGTYGGISVTSLKGSFKGQLRKTEKNGFLPTGDLINFSGTFEK